MQLPDTDNIDHQYAFKKGYRMAIEGKRITSMPSNVRRDMVMRDYFQQGWEQAVEDVSLANEQANKPEWRTRFIWFMFMVLGGIGTASLMIHNIEAEKAEQQAIIDGTDTTESLAETSVSSIENLVNENTSTPESIAINQTNMSQNTLTKFDSTSSNSNTEDIESLSLLSEEQRKDLSLTKNQALQKERIALDPITPSPILISIAQISEGIENKTPVKLLNTEVPKYIREIYFYTEVTNANGKTIYHRWRTDDQILATVELTIESDKFRTWSSKKLASAWQGQWYLEVLDSNKHVIYRKTFYYGVKK